MLSQHATHFLVLSFGRTGSVLLSKNLQASLGNDCPMIHLKDSLESTDIFKKYKSSVLHTHSIYNRNKKSKQVDIISIRLNVVETLLSFIFSKHYQCWHDTNIKHAPFYFKGIDNLKQLAENFIIWHQWYANQLNPNSIVVVYETMVEKIPKRKNSIVYPDKHKLLLNFNDVTRIINVELADKMYASLGPLIEHQNKWDIYQYLNKNIDSSIIPNQS